MQLFRLMGMPDKMIAFNELPPELLEGVDMVDESRLPRHWKEFIGMRERHIRIAPDRDPLTGAVRTYQPIIQKGPFSFVIDWEINSNKERWQEIENYVKRTAPKDFRLMDKLADMAKPMASDAHTELTLEPEDVIIIPLNQVVAPEEPTQATVTVAPPEAPKNVVPNHNTDPILKIETKNTYKPIPDPRLTCDVCLKSFSTRQSVKNHKDRIHEKEKV